MRFPRHPHAIPVQLTGPQGSNPAYAAGGQISFLLQTLPLSFWGTHIAKLDGISLDIVGSAHSGATGASAQRPMDDVILAMFKDVEIHGCFHETPVRQDAFTGVTLPIIDEMSGGGERACQEQVPLLDSTDVQNFETSVFIPLCDGRGEAPENEALPTLFYKQSEMLINFQPEGVVEDEGQNPLTIDDATIRATAWVVPSREITMGPVTDWQLFQSAAVSGSDEVILQNLGGRTGLGGTQPDAALVDLLMLTNAWTTTLAAGGADTSVAVGSFNASSLTQFACAFLGMDQSQDVLSLFSILPRALGKTRGVQGVFSATPGDLVGYLAPRSGFPWGLLAGSVANDADIRKGLKAIAFTAGSRKMQNTKCKVVAGTQSFKRTITGGASGTDNTLCSLKRAFTEDALQAAKVLLMQQGLVQMVCGTESVDWEPIGARKGPVNAVKARFLPRRLAPVAKADLTGR